MVVNGDDFYDSNFGCQDFGLSEWFCIQMDSLKESNRIWRATKLNETAILFLQNELEIFMRQCWSALLPDLLAIAHFHLRVLTHYNAVPSARDSRDVFGGNFGTLKLYHHTMPILHLITQNRVFVIEYRGYRASW